MQDRVTKTKEDVQRGKEKYEISLQELNNHNPKYMEEMKAVFDKCQIMEAQRLQFFKDTLFSIQKCLNISHDPVYVICHVFYVRFIILVSLFFKVNVRSI